MMKKESIIFVVTGVLSFIYWSVPVIQFYLYDSISEKSNDYYVFFLSSSVYQFLLMFEESPLPFLIQLIFFLLSWWILKKLMVIFVDKIKKLS